jgi:hypothetical protein
MLIQKLWQVAWDQWDHWNDVIHQHENLVTIDVAVITTHMQEELATGAQGILRREGHLFQEHCIVMAYREEPRMVIYDVSVESGTHCKVNTMISHHR